MKTLSLGMDAINPCGMMVASMLGATIMLQKRAMAQLTFDDFPELNGTNVHIANKDELLEKINKVINDGHKKLQIVADFDHTLTRQKMEDGTVVPTTFDLFQKCPSVPQKYKDENVRLAKKYRPIEVDPNMKREEKVQHMTDWYRLVYAELKGVKFPREELFDVCRTMKNYFRIGVNKLIMWTNERKVPVLVFSAGLGECVAACLETADFKLDNVKVVSNFLSLDKEGKVLGLAGQVIHTLNKNESALIGTDYHDMVKERSNVILMGDNDGDAGMADGMAHCEVVIKVGFLGRNIDENLPKYRTLYDVVLVDVQNVDFVNAILNKM